MSYFKTKSHDFIQEPQSELLLPLYNTLKDYRPMLDGSQVYEELVNVYMYQVFLLKELEETKHENNQIKSA